MEKELRIYKAYFQRGKDPQKIYLFIPYDSRSMLIDGLFEEELKPGCFAKSLRSGRDVKSFWNHNSGMVLGSTKAGTMKIRDTEKGLDVTLDPPNNSWGRDALESINRGDTDGCSFGFSPNMTEFNEDGSVRYIIQADLWEISPTAIPAYPESKAYARSQNNTNLHETDLRKYFDGREKKMKKNYSRVDKIFSKNPWDSNAEYLRAVINANALSTAYQMSIAAHPGKLGIFISQT
jgi:hypothetical protein